MPLLVFPVANNGVVDATDVIFCYFLPLFYLCSFVLYAFIRISQEEANTNALAKKQKKDIW